MKKKTKNKDTVDYSALFGKEISNSDVSRLVGVIMEDVNSKFDLILEKINATDTRIDRLEQRFDKMEQRFNQMEQRFELRFKRVETALIEHSRLIKNLDAKITDNTEMTSKFVHKVADHDVLLDKHEKILQSL